MGAQALYITKYRGKVHQLVLVGPSRLSLEALIPSFFFSCVCSASKLVVNFLIKISSTKSIGKIESFEDQFEVLSFFVCFPDFDFWYVVFRA